MMRDNCLIIFSFFKTMLSSAKHENSHKLSKIEIRLIQLLITKDQIVILRLFSCCAIFRDSVESVECVVLLLRFWRSACIHLLEVLFGGLVNLANFSELLVYAVELGWREALKYIGWILLLSWLELMREEGHLWEVLDLKGVEFSIYENWLKI